MEYDKLESDFEKATCKLIALFEGMGFEIIPSVDTEMMFINAGMIDKRFDKIILE